MAEITPPPIPPPTTPAPLPFTTPATARYASDTAQPIPGWTDTVVAFEDEPKKHFGIERVAQDGGHRFVFRLAGVWAVTATARFAGGGDAGERYVALVSDNQGARDVVTATGGYNGSTPETANLAYADYFPAGSYLEVTAWQTGNESLDLEGSPLWKNITFARIG